jgi:hypothetical protein
MAAGMMLSLCLLSSAVQAQRPLSAENSAVVERFFDQGFKGDRLACAIDPLRPFLDFAFRFEAGYILRCPVKEFNGEKGSVVTFVRITPAGAAATILGETYMLPSIPQEMKGHTEIKKLNSYFESSGVFTLGEGRYSAEFAAVDNHGRVFQDRWQIHIARSRGERAVTVAVKPLSVEPIAFRSWDGELGSGGTGTRLTIFLDATPINPNSTKLRIWDRALLLDSLASLLRHLPCDAVRLVAFNLDQQREIFRQDPFDRTGFVQLAQALRDLELGTVSYKVVGQENGWMGFLANLSNEEVTRKDPSDAVVFLGPTTHLRDKMPAEFLKPAQDKKPAFFYLRYSPIFERGREFPDAIQRLTAARNGTVLIIHSPGELAEAIQRMQKQWDTFSQTQVSRLP